MKIAIIGSGISGLSCAYFLRNKAEIDLYEAESKLGGHANTATIKINDKTINVDTGFMVYNPEMYPNFTRLLSRLSVKSIKTDMSLSVEIEDTFLFRSDFPKGVFIQKENIFKLTHYKLLTEIIRFRKIAKLFIREVSEEKWNISLKKFLDDNNFSQIFRERYLFPQITAIWSCTSEFVDSFPALATLTFFNNHKLLNNKRASWYTISGGSQVYVDKIHQLLINAGVKIYLNTPVLEVFRKENVAIVKTIQDIKEYDLVISAVHADILAKILTDKNLEEAEALACFKYTDNKVILHDQFNVLPKKRSAWASWNYLKTKDSREVFTYYMNSLQDLETKSPVLVSLNPTITIKKEAIFSEYLYSHPQYSMSSVQGQEKIKKLQNTNKLLFTGAHLGYGFHEDGITSTLDALKEANIEPEW